MADSKKSSVGERAAGFGERITGNIKEGVGRMSGDRDLEHRGATEAAEGRARSEGERANGPLVTGLYRDPDEVERAYGDLTTKHGYRPEDVSVLMSDETRKRYWNADISPDGAKITEGSKALEGLGVGSAVGGTLGALIGGIAAIGTTVLFPGLGIVIAGPLAAAFAGAGAGGATGGLLGALVGAGIPEERAVEYERGLNEGGIVLGTRARDAEHARELERHYSSYGATNIRR